MEDIFTRHDPQAFEKSSDDIIVKYSQDLFLSSTVWCSANLGTTADSEIVQCKAKCIL